MKEDAAEKEQNARRSFEGKDFIAVLLSIRRNKDDLSTAAFHRARRRGRRWQRNRETKTMNEIHTLNHLLEGQRGKGLTMLFCS